MPDIPERKTASADLPPLVILTGPTAVGKTSLSIRLAGELGGEIISADSVQVYRRMDIGSAKILPDEMQGIPHHLIDILEPTESFDAFRFRELAKEKAAQIHARGKLPIVVGGTGFYIQALLRDIHFSQQETDEAYRQSLWEMAERDGAQVLHEMLRKADPESADAIPAENIKRVIRALEYHHTTGQPISVHNREESLRPAAYRACYFLLSDVRERLYERIDRRVDEMMEAGLEGEVRGLLEEGVTPEMTSMQAIGYKEMVPVIRGAYTAEEAAYRIKRNTRHFAKRQLTWFRREGDVIWVPKDRYGYDEDAILRELIRQVKETLCS